MVELRNSMGHGPWTMGPNHPMETVALVAMELGEPNKESRCLIALLAIAVLALLQSTCLVRPALYGPPLGALGLVVVLAISCRYTRSAHSVHIEKRTLRHFASSLSSSRLD